MNLVFPAIVTVIVLFTMFISQLWTELKVKFCQDHYSPVHVVLVSLLVDQLSGLFLIFFGRPNKKLSSLREFLVSLWEFLVDQISFWYTKIFFGRPNFFLVYQKFPETDQKFSETGNFFFGRPKKNEKKTGQLVYQETDQNHMDGTTKYSRISEQ